MIYIIFRISSLQPGNHNFDSQKVVLVVVVLVLAWVYKDANGASVDY